MTDNLTLALAALLFWAPTAPAATISISPPVQVGTITSAQMSEVSGIVGSHSIPGTLWVHNDRGDTARFFAIGTNGALQGTFPLVGASAFDWEDIAIGPKSGGGNYLYLGDIGDNSSGRANVSIFRVTEPTSSASANIPSGQWAQSVLQYPDGPHNAESMFVDPIQGDFYIVTKSAVGHVYKASASIFGTPGVHTMSFVTDLNASAPLFEPSAADMSPDGHHILIRDRSTTAYLFERATGQSVFDALSGTAIPVTLAVETQGEAIGWAADGSGFYTTSEWSSSGPRPIYFYGFSVPEPATLRLGILAMGLLLARLAKKHWR